MASAADRPLAGTYAYNKQKGAPVVAAALPHPGGGIPGPARGPSRSNTGSVAAVSAEDRGWMGQGDEEAWTRNVGERSGCENPPIEGLEELMGKCSRVEIPAWTSPSIEKCSCLSKDHGSTRERNTAVKCSICAVEPAVLSASVSAGFSSSAERHA